MNKRYMMIGLYFLAAVLFLVAFAANNDSGLRWVFLFCAVTFGSVGASFLARARRGKL